MTGADPVVAEKFLDNKKYLLFHKYDVTEMCRLDCMMHMVSSDCME